MSANDTVSNCVADVVDAGVYFSEVAAFESLAALDFVGFDGDLDFADAECDAPFDKKLLADSTLWTEDG